MNARPVADIISTVNGLHTNAECQLLSDYAAQVTDGCIVEIGSFQGLSTLILANGSAPSIPVYSIDPHEQSNSQYSDRDRVIGFQHALRLDLALRIRPVNLTSAEAGAGWRRPIGLLFVDGVHSFEAVKQDLALFLPCVLVGGLVAIHDMNLPGIAEAVAIYADKLEQVASVDVLAIYRKVKA